MSPKVEERLVVAVAYLVSQDERPTSFDISAPVKDIFPPSFAPDVLGQVPLLLDGPRDSKFLTAQDAPI